MDYWQKKDKVKFYGRYCYMRRIKEAFSKRWNYFCKNPGFILTLFITYGFGVFFVYLAWEHQVRFSKCNNIFQLFSIIMENIIPTTVVYILGCLVNNMIEIMPILQGEVSSQSENKSIVYNILTLIFLLVYVIFYCVYMYNSFSIALFIIGSILTIFLLFLSIQGYKEMHPGCTRSISS